MPTLGTCKKKYLFSVSGILPDSKVEQFATGPDGFIHLAGMTPARPGRIDHYPYKGGGGEGYTAYFPLMESYLVIDVYTDLNETEILLSTCKPERINLKDLEKYLSSHVGTVKEVGVL